MHIKQFMVSVLRLQFLGRHLSRGLLTDRAVLHCGTAAIGGWWGERWGWGGGTIMTPALQVHAGLTNEMVCLRGAVQQATTSGIFLMEGTAGGVRLKIRRREKSDAGLFLRGRKSTPAVDGSAALDQV